MGAWWVFGALGMYPAMPGTDVLALGSPLFPHVAIRLPRGTLRHRRPPGGPGTPLRPRARGRRQDVAQVRGCATAGSPAAPSCASSSARRPPAGGRPPGWRPRRSLRRAHSAGTAPAYSTIAAAPAAARVPAAAHLPGLAVAGHGLHAAEEEVLLLPAPHGPAALLQSPSGASSTPGSASTSRPSTCTRGRVDRRRPRSARGPPRRGWSGGSPSGCGWSRPSRGRAPGGRRAAPRWGPSCSARACPARAGGSRAGSGPARRACCSGACPVPGTTTPEQEPFEQVTVAQRPSASITETWVVLPRRERTSVATVSSASRARNSSRKPSLPRPVEELRVAGAVGGGDHLGHHRRVVRAVQPLEDAERVRDQDAAGRGRRVGEHVAAAEAHARRRALLHPVAAQVLAREQPAALQHPAGDAVGQLALVEEARALGAEAIEQVAELGQPDRLAGAERCAPRARRSPRTREWSA